MTTFTDFFSQRLEAGGFTTEDALASILPLARQFAVAHRAGLVAPLQGIEPLRVDNTHLWFEEGRLQKPTLHTRQVEALQQPAARAVEVVGQYRVSLDVEEGREDLVSLQVGRRGEPLTQPVYLPGYVSWEHELGHHDPLTDIFVLGLLLASLTCGLDLNEPEQLAEFVQHRRNLFELNPRLHPVLAKLVVRMTELNRHRRPQDLGALLKTLENYRDQDVDFDLDLARQPAWETADRPSRRALILSCLQQRLFEISRRNRLLHFRATTQTINLTWASVPLSFDVENIRPEQILTWGHDFKKSVIAGRPVSLNKHLRFEEALYLPGQLDQIRNEARRDLTEYGFAQLRLVVCFLRWTNLKEKPVERFDSPLVLLPVRLTKTKGVRDVFTLEPLSTEAEINPVLRHYFKQLYAVELPEHVELTESSLDELYAHLAAQVQGSEPAVTIEKIDRPRINLIQASAQRRLEQYRRRVRLSGRGVRSFQELDYSYSRDNYHPLGLRLFQTRLCTQAPRLRTLVEESPRPRTFMMPVAPAPDKERRLFSVAEDASNPYQWEFDLCTVTLGNFHYRKMSLVRDYAVLLGREEGHPGFDAIFSLEPRASLTAPPAPLPLEESYPIVSCDPTQGSALALARTGQNFIIQGPPGTGKSQTITNLIADYVARGQRVLFVCEKRAALDVVYHRLQQAGLQQLCCLIHDSQDDKKEFILNLKQTYEGLLETKEGQAAKSEENRQRLLKDLKKELAPLEHVRAAMQAIAPEAGMPLRQLLERAIELREHTPELAPRAVEQLPAYRLWHENFAALERLQGSLAALQGNTVLAQHPLKRLHGRFATEERPLGAIQQTLAKVTDLLERILPVLKSSNLPAECWDSLDKTRQLVACAAKLEFLAERGLLAVLEPKSELSIKLAGFRKQVAAKQQEIKRAQRKTTGWRQKLMPDETLIALQQARALESSSLRFFKPRWWRLRSLLRRCYDFRSHTVQPTWTQILSALLPEQRLAAQVEEVEAKARAEFSFDGSLHEFAQRVSDILEAEAQLPAPLKEAQRALHADAQGNERVRHLVGLQANVAQLADELAALLVDHEGLSFAELQDELNLIEESLDELPEFLPCLKELANLPAPLASAWRGLALSALQVEAGSAKRTASALLRAEPELARFNGAVQAGHLGALEELYAHWQSANAAAVRDSVCRRFLERVRVASLPHAQLNAEQKEFKTLYNRGRRELEHEFGKTMRYRSIRDLVAGDSGRVLQDLKPVWLMSPFSVSDTLPLQDKLFDVVIFDEASQVTLEEAVPALFRAPQVLVVGDEMQLPPSRFFSAAQADEESLLVEDAAGQEVEYDLSSNSLLNHAARQLPATLLGWHYRSRSESLISYSNAAFYQGRLLTVPEVALSAAAVREILVHAAEDGGANVVQLLERPVSFHLLERGLYQNRRNPAEADYIAQLVRGLLARADGRSLGIIAFSEAQQGEIEQALQRLAHTDDDFRVRLEAEWMREQEGQFVGLLVKNLENIQGDERDVILLSVCYGPAPNGKMLMNFGPINQSGGERRLNVAFSRAKHHMVLVSSIRHHAITNDYNDGARALKNYLRYAETLSAGDLDTARRILWEINPAEDVRRRTATNHGVSAALTARLRERGYHVDTDVGQSDFRCDLAVRGEADSSYRLGILVDTEEYYQTGTLLERGVLRPRLLRNFGWTVYLVLTKDWFEDENAVLHSLEALLTGASSESVAVVADDVAWKCYLEQGDKFWEVRVAGADRIVRFGRLGTDGQTKTKTFPSARVALSDGRRLAEEKRARGFVDVG
jgi:predicted DNA-binding WGR domain protein